MLSTSTSAAGEKAIASALDTLDQTINDPDLESSPAAQIAKFAAALQQYAQEPQNTTLARATVTAAGDLANSLNSATQTVQQVRVQADADIASSVSRVNDLLAQFQAVNDRIKLGTSAGADVTDDLDQRDQILTSISEEIGVRTVTRGNNDMAIYTDNGLTLFDTRPRTVSFSPTLIYQPSTQGGSVVVDGVAVTGDTGLTGSISGRIAALAQVRDSITVTYQNQLDEIARGLVEAGSPRATRARPRACPMRQVCSPGTARRPCRQAAPCRSGWRGRSRSTLPSIQLRAAIRTGCATGAPPIPATPHTSTIRRAPPATPTG